MAARKRRAMEMHILPLSTNGFQTIKCDPDQFVDDFFFFFFGCTRTKVNYISLMTSMAL